MRQIVICLAVSVAGCLTATSKPNMQVHDLMVPNMLPGRSDQASQPAGTDVDASAAGAPDIDVQQLSGQIVAGVQAELSNRVELAVTAAMRTELRAQLTAELEATGIKGDVAGYRSEFSIGAVLVVCLSLAVILTDRVLSHRREIARIQQNGKHGAPAAERMHA